MSGRLSWRGGWNANVRDQSAEGAATRARMGAAFDVEQRKVTEILGIEAGYRYTESPIVATEAGEGPDPDNRQYVPTTWPGARIPHVWLQDGSALHDRLGFGYTLLRLGATDVESAGIEAAMRSIGAPIRVMDVPDTLVREIFERDLVLVRPDLHVAWRGNSAPNDPRAVAALATGHRSSH